MKKLILLFSIFFLSFNALISQNSVLGIWEGRFPKANDNLFMQFIFSEGEKGVKTLINTPEQGVFDLAASKTFINGDSVEVNVAMFKAQYLAKLQGDTMFGVFCQAGQRIILNLVRTPEHVAYKLSRPQTPKEPFAYYVEEVVFPNKKAKIELSGTLTLPDTNKLYPVAVLVSGSGAQDRNEEIFKHKIFMVIADYFAKHGIGVLRYDDRGVGKSTGKFADATTDDFASDAVSAIDFLKKHEYVNSKRLGIVGHSEGAMIAMKLGANKDVYFAVSMAGVGIPCDQLMVLQQDLIYAGSNVDEETRETFWNFSTKVFGYLQTKSDDEVIRGQITEAFNETLALLPEDVKVKFNLSQPYLVSLFSSYFSTWFRYFISIKPSDYIPKIKCNFLAINGDKDIQVPAKENIEAIQYYVKKDVKGKTMEFKIFDGLNHLFQPCEKGLITEYGMIETTVDEGALKFMADWINKVCGEPLTRE